MPRAFDAAAASKEGGLVLSRLVRLLGGRWLRGWRWLSAFARWPDIRLRAGRSRWCIPLELEDEPAIGLLASFWVCSSIDHLDLGLRVGSGDGDFEKGGRFPELVLDPGINLGHVDLEHLFH